MAGEIKGPKKVGEILLEWHPLVFRLVPEGPGRGGPVRRCPGV